MANHAGILRTWYVVEWFFPHKYVHFSYFMLTFALSMQDLTCWYARAFSDWHQERSPFRQSNLGKPRLNLVAYPASIVYKGWHTQGWIFELRSLLRKIYATSRHITSSWISQHGHLKTRMKRYVYKTHAARRFPVIIKTLNSTSF